MDTHLTRPGVRRLAAIAGIALSLVGGLTHAATPQRLTGRKLVLRDDATRVEKRRITVVSRDPATTLGGGEGSADDPMLHGATLRVGGREGSFDTMYELPASGWTLLGRRGRAKGFRYRGPAPLRSVTVQRGRGLRIRARGAGLGHALGVDPRRVDVTLRLGAQRYCVGFGGTTAFVAGARFVATGAPAPEWCARNRSTWPVHAVDDRFRGANGLHEADVDHDGFPDWVTNYEFDQRFVIQFHPGPGGVRRRWSSVIAWQPTPLAAGFGVNPESSALGDLDGDGNVDLITAQGWSALPQFEGNEAGVRVVWGPPRPQVYDAAAWLAGDAGRIPATVDRGHYLWVRPFDVNGDGATDVVAGGRIHGGNQRTTGPQWIEAPGDPLVRRDLWRWAVHDIDPAQIDGHGFALVDVDDDGDADVVDANADFDTPESEETVHWYENPGTGTPAQRVPWTKHELYRGPEFDPKPQIAVADLDRDGLTDLLTQVEPAVYWFRKTTRTPPAFERIVIPKDPRAQFFARPLRVADVDGDGRLDLIGGLSHRTGDIPYDKASVFWMRHTGAVPGADGWITEPIRWGSDKTMLLSFQNGFAEKWDQFDVRDLDGDGDVDVLANCEEWWENGGNFEALQFYDPLVNPSSVSVVWFENRVGEEPRLAGERDGLIVVEAEHHTTLGDGSWIERNRFPGHAGDGYMHMHNARSLAAPLAPDATLGLEFQVAPRGGSYWVWVRRWVPSVWGYGNGGERSDSAWLAAGATPAAVLDDQPGQPDQWTWVRAAAPVALSAGTHVVRIRAREHGYAIDRLVLTTDPGWVPTGDGPPETLVAP